MNSTQIIARGFSLVEALVTMAILSFALLSLGSFEIRLNAEESHARRTAEATAMAVSQVETFLLQDGTDALWNSVAAGSDTRLAAETAASTDFTRAWAIDDQGSLKKVAIEVMWPGQNLYGSAQPTFPIAVLVNRHDPAQVRSLYTSGAPAGSGPPTEPEDDHEDEDDDRHGNDQGKGHDDDHNEGKGHDKDDPAPPHSGEEDNTPPPAAACSCQRSGNSNNAHSLSGPCDAKCCGINMPDDTPPNGVFGFSSSMCPVS